jgi:hypothetical protein
MLPWLFVWVSSGVVFSSSGVAVLCLLLRDALSWSVGGAIEAEYP